MYVDSKNKRILLRNGVSIKDVFELARDIVSGKEINAKAIEDENTEKYFKRYREDLSFVEEDAKPLPLPNEHSVEEEIELIDLILTSPRFQNTEEGRERISEEVEFFKKTGNIKFLLEVNDLIQEFKRNEVVWGVGRGSGSASYVLYLMEVHDIDPIKYDIPFYELSKEFKSKYE